MTLQECGKHKVFKLVVKLINVCDSLRILFLPVGKAQEILSIYMALQAFLLDEKHFWSSYRPILVLSIFTTYSYLIVKEYTNGSGVN